jgi:hypothetical protein
MTPARGRRRADSSRPTFPRPGETALGLLSGLAQATLIMVVHVTIAVREVADPA